MSQLQKPGIFVTGTDTGIGKTTVCGLLGLHLREAGAEPGYFKPVQTGDDDDTKTYLKLSGASNDGIIPPVYRFAAPAAPLRAARQENQEIEIEKLHHTWAARAAQKTWLVEGAGGLLVPLTSKVSFRELARILELDVLVVASTRLGTINHTLLTLESIAQAGLRTLGVVLVGPEDPGLGPLLEELAGVPVLGELLWLDENELTSEPLRSSRTRLACSRMVEALKTGAAK